MARAPGTSGLRGRLAAGTLLLAGAAMAATGLGVFDADADEVLQNGGFESWVGDKPSGWTILSGTPSRDDSRSVSGAALHLTGTSEVTIQQVVVMGAGSTANTSIGVSSDIAADVRLAITPLDEDFVDLDAPLAIKQTISAASTFTTVSGPTAELPSSTTYARITISVSPIGVGTFSAWLDSASVVESVALPTSTPTATATATPTSADEGGSPVGIPTATPTEASSSGKPTATSKPAKTPTRTPTRAPTPKPPVAKTPTPTAKPQQTPTPSNPAAAMTGLILNGDFEALDNGKPAYWAKYGGEMGSTADAYGGKWSATLSSTTTSTKWLNQVVTVDAGAWYRLTAVARAENATAFLRISWYGSPDGSGSQLDSLDGGETAAVDWTTLDTGPVQAPDDASSARVKLMLRPASGSGRVLFDDVWLVPAEASAAKPSATATARAATATKTGTAPIHTATPRTGARPTQTATGGLRPRSTATTHATAAPLSATGALTGPSPLRLSEFMSDPPKAGNDGSDEWVEITNVTDATVSTAGWRISDAKAADDIPAASIEPGGFLVIAGKSADTGSATGVVRVVDGVIGNGLSNGGDAIALLAPSGEVADAVSYGSNTDIFEPPPPAPGAGKSLGSRDPAADEAAENWDITLAPSPGEPNTFSQAALAHSSATAGTGSLDEPADDPQARALTAGSAHDVPTLGTLDWALIAGILASVSVVAGVFGRRYVEAAWKRVRRGH